jgi:prevent-host-death family protein
LLILQRLYAFVQNETAMIEVTVSEARERLADLLGQVEHGHEQVTITRHGKAVAAIVTMEDLAFMESAEDAFWRKQLDEERARPGYDPDERYSAEEVFAELAKGEAAE